MKRFDLITQMDVKHRLTIGDKSEIIDRLIFFFIPLLFTFSPIQSGHLFRKKVFSQSGWYGNNQINNIFEI